MDFIIAYLYNGVWYAYGFYEYGWETIDRFTRASTVKDLNLPHGGWIKTFDTVAEAAQYWDEHKEFIVRRIEESWKVEFDINNVYIVSMKIIPQIKIASI